MCGRIAQTVACLSSTLVRPVGSRTGVGLACVILAGDDSGRPEAQVPGRGSPPVDGPEPAAEWRWPFCKTTAVSAMSDTNVERKKGTEYMVWAIVIVLLVMWAPVVFSR
jgi:hypothetical protein